MGNQNTNNRLIKNNISSDSSKIELSEVRKLSPDEHLDKKEIVEEKKNKSAELKKIIDEIIKKYKNDKNSLNKKETEIIVVKIDLCVSEQNFDELEYFIDNVPTIVNSYQYQIRDAFMPLVWILDEKKQEKLVDKLISSDGFTIGYLQKSKENFFTYVCRNLNERLAIKLLKANLETIEVFDLGAIDLVETAAIWAIYNNLKIASVLYTERVIKKDLLQYIIYMDKHKETMLQCAIKTNMIDVVDMICTYIKKNINRLQTTNLNSYLENSMYEACRSYNTVVIERLLTDFAFDHKFLIETYKNKCVPETRLIFHKILNLNDLTFLLDKYGPQYFVLKKGEF